MKEFLKSGQFESVELNEQKRMREKVVERWDNMNMLEGLQGSQRTNMALLYENETKALLSEATDASNSGSFETVVFPIIRRTFSKLLANDIVSVQAMNLPIGKIFYFLPVTSEREWRNANGDILTNADDMLEDGVTASHKGLMGYQRTDRRNGNKYNRFYLPDEAVKSGTYSVDGADAVEYDSYDMAVAAAKGKSVEQMTPSVTRYQGKTLYDLFYNDFLFDNTKGKVHIRVVKAEDGNIKAMYWKNGVLEEAKNQEDLRLYSDGTVRNIILEVSGFSSFNAGRLTGPDGNEMDTEEFLASLKIVASQPIGTSTDPKNPVTCFAQNEAIPFRVMTQKYGTGIVDYKSICDAEGKIYLDIDLSKPCAKMGQTIDGYLGVNQKDAFDAIANLRAAWCQYDSLELETELPEVSFKLTATVISAQENKLRATWSPEMSQDVAAFHNIDAEAELTSLLSEEIAGEIDRTILRDLRGGAAWTERWDVNGWRRMAAFSTNYTQKDWNQELISCVNRISSQIFKSTLRGSCSFIVVSAEISALLDNLEYFHVSDASAESDQYNMGIERIGSLSGRYQVYRDPYSPAWSIIVGHRGKSLLDTGYIYAPYIPMQLTPTIPNPFNFAPVKGIMTRYAKKMVNNKFYGTVKVDGLRTWDVNELR